MKTQCVKMTCVLAVAVLGLIPTIMGTAAMADGAPVANQSASLELQGLEQMKARATPDTTLLRPL